MDLSALHREHIQTLLSRTSEALAKTGFPALVIHSGTALKRTDADDQYWPLRPTPHFQHWLPLAEPGCALVIEPGKKLDMRCRVAGCKNPSKGPRFGFMCEKHLKALSPRRQREAREKWNAAHPKKAA